MNYLCSPEPFMKWELSSVGSERLPYKQRVGGSNPSAPTDLTKTIEMFFNRFFCFCSLPENIFSSLTKQKKLRLASQCFSFVLKAERVRILIGGCGTIVSNFRGVPLRLTPFKSLSSHKTTKQMKATRLSGFLFVAGSCKFICLGTCSK